MTSRRPTSTLTVVLSITLALHLGAVLLGAAYFLLSITVGATPDANIGAGLALLWLSGLGSPWSWPVLGSDDPSGTLQIVAIFGSAVLNLGLHAGLLTWSRRRSLRTPRSVPAS